MQFNSGVMILLIQLYIFDMVLAPLCHHILMIEVTVNCLVYQAGFANCWLTCYYYTSAKNRHFFCNSNFYNFKF